MVSIPGVSGVPAWGMKNVFLFKSRIKEISGATKERISFVGMALAAHQRICSLPPVWEMNIHRKPLTHPISLRVKVWRTERGILDLGVPRGT